MVLCQIFWSCIPTDIYRFLLSNDFHCLYQSQMAKTQPFIWQHYSIRKLTILIDQESLNSLMELADKCHRKSSVKHQTQNVGCPKAAFLRKFRYASFKHFRIQRVKILCDRQGPICLRNTSADRRHCPLTEPNIMKGFSTPSFRISLVRADIFRLKYK